MTHSAAVWFKRCFLHSLRCVRYCGRRVVVRHGAGQAAAHPFYAALLPDLGADGADPNRQIYLLTVSLAFPVAVAVGVRDVQALSRQEMRPMGRRLSIFTRDCRRTEQYISKSVRDALFRWLSRGQLEDN